MKNFIYLFLLVIGLSACGGGDNNNNQQNQNNSSTTNNSDNPSYDPNRGEGKFTHVELGDKLDAAMAAAGDKVQGVKCSPCHKMSDERLVGPGWAGVTNRRKPEWIMNFITNPDVMIDKDPAVQAQLEICLVRMPNQNLNDEEARQILEFMRQNDGVK